MNEKKAIERATAEAFIQHYNTIEGTFYQIIEHSDHPDFRCKDDSGQELLLEVTLTEDRPQDIAAALGRSNHRSVEALRNHLLKVRRGEANPLGFAISLADVSRILVTRILKKKDKAYGSNTALVVRDASPLDWPWDQVIDEIKNKLEPHREDLKKHFDKGIWIVSYGKDKLFKLL